MHIVIVGAGMSGLLAAIRLKQAGVAFTIIEKNRDVGGTWYENSYPRLPRRHPEPSLLVLLRTQPRMAAALLDAEYSARLFQGHCQQARP
jgi:phytoene dehydrogenase-like protein